MTASSVIVRLLGRQNYQSCWHAMQQFTQQRDEHTPDEIWLLEHDPVFTQGQNGKPEHVLDAGDIPLVQTDRGGQVTYHGPGQLVAYILVDLKRKKLNVREIVTLLENATIHVLAKHSISAIAKREAPGVYTDNKKICSVGLRIRKGCSYHGLALNVKMDLAPFARINPCGFKQLTITQIADVEPSVDFNTVTTQLMDYLITNLGYNDCLIKS